MTKKIVDTHVHVWDLKRAAYPWLKDDISILNRTWHIEELEAERIKTGVTEGVLVQASGNIEDTDLMFETAANAGWISGVVAWLPLLDTSATQTLLEEKYLKEKYFKGVRHQIHDEPDPKWLLQPSVIESLKILAAYDIPYDVVGIKPVHIETVLVLAEKVPGLRMVFDHLNQPPIATKEKFGKWGELMKEAAQHKSLYAKISGLGTASGDLQAWNAQDVKPYIEFVVQNFGVDRCFFGGDWPVSLLAGGYAETWNKYEEAIGQLANDSEQEKIFYNNAKQFYSL
jgi:L-fuconolactonase